MSETVTANERYINGSDILLLIGGKAVGHCVTHTVTYNTETKERAVKPPLSVTATGASLYKKKGVTGLSISISFDGLQTYNEAECGADALRKAWSEAEPVEVVCQRRGADSKPYLKGKFVITSFEEGLPANEDVTYKGQLELADIPEIADLATA